MSEFQVGDYVRLVEVPGARGEFVGNVQRVSDGFVVVSTPGVKSDSSDGEWWCQPHELELIGRADDATGPSAADMPDEQREPLIRTLVAATRIVEQRVRAAADSTNPKDALGVKKAALRFVPPALTILASDAMADGAAKYGPFNWRETAVRMTVYLEAIERHLLALRDGQDRAEDSGHLHLSHIAACCAILADAAGIGMLIDDRPTAGPAADLLRERDRT